MKHTRTYTTTTYGIRVRKSGWDLPVSILCIAVILAAILLPGLLGGCAGGPHGSVSIDGPNGPIDIRFAQSVTRRSLNLSREYRGGVSLSPRHNDAVQGALVQGGLELVFDRFLAPLDLRGRNVYFWYIYTPRERAYQFRHIRPDAQVARFEERVRLAGGRLVLYLPCPTSGDVYPLQTEAEQRARLHELFGFLPPRAAVIIDEMQKLPGTSSFGKMAAGVIDEEIARGRSIDPENGPFTYNDRWRSRTAYVNSDEYERNRFAATWVKSAPRIIGWHQAFTPGWDRAAEFLDFTRACEAEGNDWTVGAPDLVQAWPAISIDQVDPRRN